MGERDHSLMLHDIHRAVTYAHAELRDAWKLDVKDKAVGEGRASLGLRLTKLPLVWEARISHFGVLPSNDDGHGERACPVMCQCARCNATHPKRKRARDVSCTT